MPVKLVTPHQLSQYNVSNAMGYARIAGIISTKQLEKSLADYISGKKSIA